MSFEVLIVLSLSFFLTSTVCLLVFLVKLDTMLTKYFSRFDKK